MVWNIWKTTTVSRIQTYVQYKNQNIEVNNKILYKLISVFATTPHHIHILIFEIHHSNYVYSWKSSRNIPVQLVNFALDIIIELKQYA